MNFLEFTKQHKKTEYIRNLLLEGYNEATFNDGINLIDSLIKKNTNRSIVRLKKPFNTNINNEECLSYFWFTWDNKQECAVSLNMTVKDKRITCDSISFYDQSFGILFNKTNKIKSKITLISNQYSIVYFIPLIYHVLNTGDFSLNNSKVKNFAKHILKESNEFRKLDIGNLTYYLFEEASKELKKLKKDLARELKPVYANRKNDPDAWKNISSDYQEIRNAINGGATNISDLDIQFKSNITIELIEDANDKKAQDELDKQLMEHEDPEMVWKEMQQYIKMVIKGINPSCILAGAPGVGKTYRVKQQLRAAGYTEGKNLWTIKGKCTPRQLYLALYNFKSKGDIILIDDADGLVGPKAPEDVINILKAALDSTSDDEGRLVSYNVSGDIRDDDGTPIAKRFYYNGGIIVITNWNVGALDTALKGRSYVHDINFTLEDVLEIIEGLLPSLSKEKLSMESKMKALDFLKEIADQYEGKIEISIRTFNICANIFESADEDFTDEDCKRMILKQLKLQADRRKIKY